MYAVGSTGGSQKLLLLGLHRHCLQDLEESGASSSRDWHFLAYAMQTVSVLRVSRVVVAVVVVVCDGCDMGVWVVPNGLDSAFPFVLTVHTVIAALEYKRIHTHTYAVRPSRSRTHDENIILGTMCQSVIIGLSWCNMVMVVVGPWA